MPLMWNSNLNLRSFIFKIHFYKITNNALSYSLQFFFNCQSLKQIFIEADSLKVVSYLPLVLFALCYPLDSVLIKTGSLFSTCFMEQYNLWMCNKAAIKYKHDNSGGVL